MENELKEFTPNLLLLLFVLLPSLYGKQEGLKCYKKVVIGFKKSDFFLHVADIFMVQTTHACVFGWNTTIIFKVNRMYLATPILNPYYF